MDFSMLAMIPGATRAFFWILLDASRAGNQKEKEAGVEKSDFRPFFATARTETKYGTLRERKGTRLARSKEVVNCPVPGATAWRAAIGLSLPEKPPLVRM
jgi:hypothetical protein